MKRVYSYVGTKENNYKVSHIYSEENEAIALKDAFDGQIYYEEVEEEIPVDRITELEKALTLLLEGATE